jgi:hypothetical protein
LKGAISSGLRSRAIPSAGLASTLVIPRGVKGGSKRGRVLLCIRGRGGNRASRFLVAESGR